MRVLIVESESDLAWIWAAHVQRGGAEVGFATTIDEAIEVLQERVIDVVVLDLEIGGESGLPIADFAQYRQPNAAVILVTRSSFFSDGSLFQLLPNARGFLPAATKPDDLAALVAHCAAS